MNISYDWYKIFCCAAECGNITFAAEKLHISQPAVSQSICRLEEAVGCTLFLRTPKGVRLTAEGEKLYHYVSAGVNAFSEGERHLKAMLRLDAGEIKIGASDMTLEFWLLPYLDRFHEKYPNVKIVITNNSTPQILELLKQERIDFGAVSDPVSCPGFEKIAVREIRDIFICSSRMDIPDNMKICELKDHLILLEHCTSTRTFLDREFRRRGFTVSPEFELSTSSQIVGFSARNFGIGCVVADFAERAIADGEVREIKVSDPLPSRNMCIIRKKEEHSRAVEELFNMIPL